MPGSNTEIDWSDPRSAIEELKKEAKNEKLSKRVTYSSFADVCRELRSKGWTWTEIHSWLQNRGAPVSSNLNSFRSNMVRILRNKDVANIRALSLEESRSYVGTPL